MHGDASKSLLPNGLRDVLPPEAAHESTVVRGLVDRFSSEGYQRVDPPLVEFEDSLLAGAGAGTADHCFRLMDPVSQRMMGVRTDMTVQVARIATSRLTRQARPLRLCYAGPTLRVRGTQLRPERQVTQAGCELIGHDSPATDAEVIALAANALQGVGLSGLSVDIALPTLAPRLFESLKLDRETQSNARAALDCRDAKAIADLGGEAARLFGALLEASGRAEEALSCLQKIKGLPDDVQAEIARLSDVLPRLQQAAPALSVTVDAVERRGFEYQTGLSFTLFAKQVRGELGRGGRYLAGSGANKTGPKGETATGFTLYLDSVLRGTTRPSPIPRCYLPATIALEAGPRLRNDGWVTVAGLDEAEEVVSAARRLGCSHYLDPQDGETPSPKAV